MKTLKYIINICLTCLMTTSYGQSINKDYKPSEVIFATDIVGLGQSLFTGNTKLEFHSKVDFHQFYLAGDYGIIKVNSVGEGFNYISEGSFFRVGPQVNFMPYNKHRSSIYFGLMYARASFKDQIYYSQAGQGWNDSSFDISNNNLTSNWGEAVMGINVKVTGAFYLGYVLRFKFANHLNGYDELKPLNIPGFGDANKSASFGFNYYIIYKLRFRDKPIPVKPKVVPRRSEAQKESNQSAGL